MIFRICKLAISGSISCYVIEINVQCDRMDDFKPRSKFVKMFLYLNSWKYNKIMF